MEEIYKHKVMAPDNLQNWLVRSNWKLKKKHNAVKLGTFRTAIQKSTET